MKSHARLVALVGAALLGWFLLGSGRRDVVLVYDISAVPDAVLLDVKISRDGELVRRAEFRVEHPSQVRHHVKLQDGTYLLAWQLAPAVLHIGRPDGPPRGERELVVDGDVTIVLPLGR